MMADLKPLRFEEVELSELAARAGYRLHAAETARVGEVHEDSRRCATGDLFVAIPGTRDDGLAYAADAVQRGAVAVAAETDPRLGVPWIEVPDARVAAGRLADIVYRHPSLELALIGVTGTNGKTTTAHILAQILPGAVGVIGTTGVQYPGVHEASLNTTPGPTELRRHLRGMVAAGCVACCMEVSSHALVQRRVDGLRFAAAVYTNLTGDHIDYHGSMDEYEAAKARLFDLVGADGHAIVNANDAACRRVRTQANLVRFHPGSVDVTPRGTKFEWRGRKVSLPLVGRHNAENAAAALETAVALGADEEELMVSLQGVLPARGRLETVQVDPFLVVVDYAHTDDALENALRAVRDVARGMVILVFGCGGDRDRSKRPRMGAVASRYADRVFLTNDNPRTEDPRRIADEVLAGLGGRPATIELDRAAAIRAAVASARPGDAVVIAGKGHETYQEVGTRRLPFDDFVAARAALDPSSKDPSQASSTPGTPGIWGSGHGAPLP